MLVLLAIGPTGCGARSHRAAALDADADTGLDSGSRIERDADVESGGDADAATGSDTDADAGCEVGAPRCLCSASKEPAVVLGFFDGTFRDMRPGQPVELLPDPNGCCVFYADVRITGLTVDPPVRWAYAVEDGEGALWGRMDPGLLLPPGSWTDISDLPGWCVFPDLRFVVMLREPEDLTGRLLYVTVRITDGSGRRQEGTASVVPYSDDDRP